MTKNLKKLLAYFLTIAMVFSIIPLSSVTVMAAETPDPTVTVNSDIYLKVEGETLKYSTNNGGVWNDYSGSFTISGGNGIETVKVESGKHDIILNGVDLKQIYIDIESGLTQTLTLVGNNTINNTGSNFNDHGIMSKASLCITGSGRLTSTGSANNGIYSSYGTVTINSGTVIGNGNGDFGSGIKAYNGVIINGGIVTASSVNYAGIYNNSSDKNVTISGGTVTATGGDGKKGIDISGGEVIIANTMQYATHDDAMPTTGFIQGDGTNIQDSLKKYVNVKAYVAPDPDIEKVATAKSLIESGTYTFTQATANNDTDAKAEIAKQINALDGMTETEIIIDTTDITIQSFDAAIAETSAENDGVNGSFDFTAKVKKGEQKDTTTSESVTITYTEFTGETDTQAVARAKGLIVDGSVNVDFGAVQADKTSAVQTYVNGLLSGTGVSAIVAFKENTDVYTVTITKDRVRDTKDITMTVNVAPDPDIAILNSAKDKAEGATYPNPTKESDYADNTALKNYVKDIVKTAVDNDAVTLTVNEVSYSVAVNGTKENPQGTQGIYVFTITVSKGAQSDTTTQKTLTIPTVEYKDYSVIEGDGQTPTVGTNGEIRFKVDGDLTKFEKLLLNGEFVPTNNYAATSGSVVITLNADYVKTLPVGKQVFTVAFTNGEANVNMEVMAEKETTPPPADPTTTPTDGGKGTDVPQTGDNSNIMLYLFIALMSLVVLGFIGYRKKVRNS